MKFSAARSELDSTIVEIELTLVSIIQGVALTVLIENARDLISGWQIFFWPYVIAGLLVIFVFWSRAVLHIITVIRWPLEFGHNFLYIACALVEAILFAQIGKPARWFGFGAAFIAIGWTLFVYDLRLIHARMRDSAGPFSNRLSSRVLRDQWMNIAALLPGIFLLNIVFLFAIRAWPEFFIARNGHVWLIAGELVAFVGYLIYVVRFYVDLAPLIAEARQEWRGS
ncbi:MAG TPA: hypothetical protein VH170_01450 [Chthoniobacterales bacterium]|jgi:hypothetical protein|nr:hypothetical protein [Chthoniobacterales bacterium]